MKENSGKKIIEWIHELYKEIKEPTLIDRAIFVSLLSAEIESWKKDPTVI